MANGNGQISRLLINDLLRRDGAVPAPFILPVSATTSTAVNGRGYDQEMRKKAAYLDNMHTARAQIKSVIEGLDTDIDRIIQSVRGNDGKVSNKLRKDFPMLDDPDTGPEIVRIVRVVLAHRLTAANKRCLLRRCKRNRCIQHPV